MFMLMKTVFIIIAMFGPHKETNTHTQAHEYMLHMIAQHVFMSAAPVMQFNRNLYLWRLSIELFITEAGDTLSPQGEFNRHTEHSEWVIIRRIAGSSISTLGVVRK